MRLKWMKRNKSHKRVKAKTSENKKKSKWMHLTRLKPLNKYCYYAML